MAELGSLGKELQLHCENGRLTIRGSIHFTADYEGENQEDRFAIEIAVPEDYPCTLPTLRECDGRIPESYHTYDNGALCVGTPLDAKTKFAASPNLLGFMRELAIPYLYSFSCWEKHGTMPYGERPHGGRGILESYRERFKVDSDSTAASLLLIPATTSYRGHKRCPCGSRLRIRDCHGPVLMEVSNLQRAEQLLVELVQCVWYMEKSGQTVPEEVRDDRVLHRMRQRLEAARAVTAR